MEIPADCLVNVNLSELRNHVPGISRSVRLYGSFRDTLACFMRRPGQGNQLLSQHPGCDSEQEEDRPCSIHRKFQKY